jgi:hypothetical protein
VRHTLRRAVEAGHGRDDIAAVAEPMMQDITCHLTGSEWVWRALPGRRDEVGGSPWRMRLQEFGTALRFPLELSRDAREYTDRRRRRRGRPAPYGRDHRDSALA